MPISLASAAVVLLLLGELLALTLAFDTQRLDAIPTIWAQLVAAAPQVLRWASSVALAASALTLLNRPGEIKTLLAQPRRPRFRVIVFTAHAAALTAFAVVTSVIVSAGAPYRAHQAVWTLAWLTSGSLTVAAWARLLFPFTTWRALMSTARGSLLAGVGAGTIAWAAGFVTEEFWIPLSRYTFALVTWMLRFVYPQTVSVPAKLLVGTRAFRVAITPQCSGYEGIGLILVFLGIYLWLLRRELRFPAALVLLPIGAALIWLANAVRIVLLIAIGTAGWKGVAAGGFHSQAGWLVFSALALGFVAVTNRYRYFRDTSADETPVLIEADRDQTTAYLGPFFVISATAMLTGAMSAGVDWLYPLRLVAAGVVLWICRREYVGLRWTGSWWAFGIGAVTFLAWVALVPAPVNPQASWPNALRSVPFGWAAAWMLLRGVGYVVIAPVAEELAFRGFLTRRLARPDFQNLPIGQFSWWSFAISSALFGALHGSLWLPATIAGMTFGLALYRRGALGEAVWAHATTNGLIAVYAWTTGQWWMWS